MPRSPTRPVAPLPRFTLRREAAASLGISINHFERRVQPELKVVICGQPVLIPVGELERWVQRPGADARRRAGAADPAAQLAFAA